MGVGRRLDIGLTRARHAMLARRSNIFQVCYRQQVDRVLGAYCAIRVAGLSLLQRRKQGGW
jgi:hypothetical protein